MIISLLGVSNASSLAVFGSWNNWQDWSTCDKTCGSGQMSRLRTCNKQDCIGKESHNSVCNVQQCPGNEAQDAHTMLSIILFNPFSGWLFF